MKKVAVLAVLAATLLFSGTALADEQTKKEDHSGHGATQVQPAAKQEANKTTAPAQTPAAADAQSHNMSTEEHQKMTTTTDRHQNMTPQEHMNMGSTGDSHSGTNGTHGDTSNGTQEESSGGGHGSHGNVVETPPNIPVLAAFGAVNGAFLLIGVWNKWFRKRKGALA